MKIYLYLLNNNEYNMIHFVSKMTDKEITTSRTIRKLMMSLIKAADGENSTKRRYIQQCIC